jgi:hypothetical protein
MNETIQFIANQDVLKQLEAIIKYYKMVSYISRKDDSVMDEALSFDGIINALLDDVLSRRIKDIVKRHSFIDSMEFIDTISLCKTDEECEKIINQMDNRYYLVSYNKILEHMPVLDGQKSIDFGEQKD